MDDPKPLEKLLEQASNPGDAATVLIFGTAGFLLDAALNPVAFLTAPQTGIASASLALGTKKSIEAIWAKRQMQKKERENEMRRAEALLDWRKRTARLDMGMFSEFIDTEFDNLRRIHREKQTSLEDLRAAIEKASTIKRAFGLHALLASAGKGQLADNLYHAAQLFHLEAISPEQLQQRMNALNADVLEERT